MEEDTQNTQSKPMMIPPDSAKFWNNRRRMAWISLLAMVIQTPLIIALVVMEKISPELVSSLSVLIGSNYTALTMIVMMYMGAATVTDVKHLNINANQK